MRGHASATTWLQRGVLGILGTTLVVAGLQATGSAVATVKVADGTVWLSNAARGTVVQVSSTSEEATATVAVATAGDTLVARQDGHDALVLDRTTGEIGRVDGTTLTYTHRQTVPGSAADLQLVSGGPRAYVLDTNQGSVRVYDSADLKLIRESPLDPGPTTAAVDSKGTLFAANRSSGQVTVVHADGTSSRQSVGSPGSTLTLVADRPYLVDPAAARVVALDPDNGKAGKRSCLDDADVPDVDVTGSGPADPRANVFTVSPQSGRLTTTDVRAGKCTTLNLTDDESARNAGGSASDYGTPVAKGDLLFVPVAVRGDVLVIDTAENQIIRTIDKSEMFAKQSAGSDDTAAIPTFELLLDDGNVWFNNLSGPEAGVLDRDGVTLSVLKYEAAQGSNGKSGNGLGVGDDSAALGVDLDPNTGIPRDDGHTADDSTQATTGDNGAAKGTGQGSGGSNEPNPSSPGAQPATLTVLPPGLPSDKSDSQGPAEVTVSGDSRPTPTSQGSSLTPAPATPARPSDQQPLPSKPVNPSQLVSTFQYSPGVVALGGAVAFTDRSTGSPPANSWQWDFGDGSSDRSPNPSHVYKAAGTYLVTLTVSNGQDSDKSRAASIQVTDPNAQTPPVANFSFDPRSAEVAEPVHFTDGSVGKISEWTWDWGDGSQSSGPDQTHAWAAPTTYRVTLTVRNQYGSQSATRSIVIVAKAEVPKASFTYQPANPIAGDRVTFTDTSLGNPTSWTWDFGDKQPGANTQATLHAFSTPGPYTVTLTVRNAKGTSTATQQLIVVAATQPPVAHMSVSGTSVVVNEKLHFSSDGSTGNPTSYTWTFGDNTTALAGTQVDHSWAKEGNYPVTLTVQNSAGRDSVSTTITVTPARPTLKADFNVSGAGRTSANPASPNQSVLFVDNSAGNPTSFTWDFGDGSVPLSGSDTAPSHPYKAAGTYNVKLTASAPGLDPSSATHQVFVVGTVDPPVADFTVSPASPRVGDAVTFSNSSTKTVAPTWRWNFDDGSGSTEQSPTHPFTAAKTYNVTLTVVNQNGQTATKTVPLTVGEKPPAPSASVAVSPSDPAAWVAGASLTFTDTTPGNVTTPVFTFPTGSVSPPAGSRSVVYAFAQPGDFPVSMKVCLASDPTNCGSVAGTMRILAPVTVPVVNKVNISGLMADGTTGGVGDPITLAADISGSPSQIEWTIGSQKFTGTSVTFTAASAGDVAWSVTATNSAGSGSAKGQLRFVDKKPPVAAFTSASTVAVGSTLKFTDQSTGLVTSWAWDFAGAGTSNLQSPEVPTSAVGTFTIKLTVTNPWGSTSVSRDIVVTMTPQITVTAGGTVDSSGATKRIDIKKGAALSLQAGPATPGVTGWQWDFGDGSNSTAAALAKTYNTTGDFTVKLTANFPGGAPTDTLIVHVT